MNGQDNTSENNKMSPLSHQIDKPGIMVNVALWLI